MTLQFFTSDLLEHFTEMPIKKKSQTGGQLPTLTNPFVWSQHSEYPKCERLHMHSLIRRLRQVIRLETKSITLWRSETLANGDLTVPKSDSILMSERSCTLFLRRSLCLWITASVRGSVSYTSDAWASVQSKTALSSLKACTWLSCPSDPVGTV